MHCGAVSWFYNCAFELAYERRESAVCAQITALGTETPVCCRATASRDERHVWFLLSRLSRVGCPVMTFLIPSQSLLCLWLPSWWSSLTHHEGQPSPWPSWSPQPACIEFGALTRRERGFHVEKTTLETVGGAQRLNQSRAKFFCSRWSSGASFLCHAI